jgi:glucokinase
MVEDALTETVEAAAGRDKVAGVGVAAAGFVDADGERVMFAPHLPWLDAPVRETLEKRWGVPVVLENDATAAAHAEATYGAARGARHAILVTLGTGIGGGLVAGGSLQRGNHGFAGEYGHMVVDPDGPPCPCGRRGCWERYASGSGLARLAREAAIGRRVSRVLEIAGGDPEAVRGEMVQQAAREGDPDAQAVIDDFGRWVALGLVNLTNALDPERFVLGGGLAAGADLYLDPIRKWFRELIYQPELRPMPEVAFARWNERAGAVGAALLHSVHESTT